MKFIALLESNNWQLQGGGDILTPLDLRQRLLPGKQVSDVVVHMFTTCMFIEEGIRVLYSGFWLQLCKAVNPEYPKAEREERWTGILRGTRKVCCILTFLR